MAKGTGGDGGIRTLDRALQPYNGLANRRLQPLGHVSNQADMPDAAASRKRLDFGRSCAPVFAQFRRFGTGIFWLIPQPTDTLEAIAGSGADAMLAREPTRRIRNFCLGAEGAAAARRSLVRGLPA